MPVGGSFSRSALNRQLGARTKWSGAITGACVLLLMPLVFLLADLPTAVLAAIVITAVGPLIQLAAGARLWRHSRPATLIAAGTFVSTLAFAPRIERGVLVGVGLSVGIHLWRELRIDRESRLEDGVLHVRPLGVLWFGASEILEDIVTTELSRHPDAEALSPAPGQHRAARPHGRPDAAGRRRRRAARGHDGGGRGRPGPGPPAGRRRGARHGPAALSGPDTAAPRQADTSFNPIPGAAARRGEARCKETHRDGSSPPKTRTCRFTTA